MKNLFLATLFVSICGFLSPISLFAEQGENQSSDEFKQLNEDLGSAEKKVQKSIKGGLDDLSNALDTRSKKKSSKKSKSGSADSEKKSK